MTTDELTAAADALARAAVKVSRASNGHRDALPPIWLYATLRDELITRAPAAGRLTRHGADSTLLLDPDGVIPTCLCYRCGVHLFDPSRAPEVDLRLSEARILMVERVDIDLPWDLPNSRPVCYECRTIRKDRP